MKLKDILEMKYNVKILKEEIDGEIWNIAYYHTRGHIGKEVCREKSLYELQDTLKLYLS